MRVLSVLAIGFFLMSGGRLCGQSADPFGSGGDPFAKQEDPFGPIDNKSPRVDPADRKPTLSPKTPQPSEAVKQVASPPAALYPHVRVGRVAAMQERIECALNRQTAFDYLDQPLKDVIEDIAFTNDIPIIIDTVALDDFGIDTATPITRSLKGISLRKALKLTLRNVGLTFLVRDEVLQITTLEVARATMSTRFYHVADLLPPDGEGKVLVELIKSSVFPDTWSGIGAITYVEHLESLVIRHHDEAFHRIEELLATTKQIVENQRPKGRAREHDPFE